MGQLRYKRSRVTIAGIGALASLCGIATATSPALARKHGAATKAPIVFGAAVGLTGRNAEFDGPPLHALELAADQLNKKGGIDGHRIKFVVQDMQGNTSLGASTAETVIRKGATVLVLPCDPDLAAPGAAVGAAQHMLTFSLCEASSRLGPQTVGKYFFTPTQSALTEGYTMAEWADLGKNWHRAFVISDGSQTYALNTSQGFVDRWKSLHQKVVGTSKVTASETTINPTISAIKAAHPQVVFVGSSMPEEATFVRELRAGGVTQPLLSNMSMDGKYWLKSVPHLSGFYYPVTASIYGDDPNPQINAFVRAYTKVHGAPVNAYALYGRVLLDLYAAAVKKAHSLTSDAVVNALQEMRNTPTLIGPITYTRTAHIVLKLPMRVMQIQGGKISFLKLWNLKKAPSLNG